MNKLATRAIACLSVLVLLCCSIPAATVSAAYENTHTNTGNMAADIVAVAETQAGYLEGSLSGTVAGSNNYQKYGLWYDNNVDYIGVQRAAWCAAFVSWCANQAGVPSSIVYYHAYCPYGVNWFKNQGRFQYAASRGGSYTPKAGDIVYFAPAGSSTSSHIGIVRYVSGGRVYTVEGNTSGQNGEVNDGGGVFLKSYSLTYERLFGYGIPAYEDNSGHTIQFETNGGSAVASVNVKDGETLAEPTAPTKYGFDFGGWYCNPELTDPYDFSTPVPYGFTLYAKWNEAYWGANTNLMPIEGQLILNSYNDADEKLWPYYNSDGSVTMYSGVNSDWAWPSATMEYANSVDSANDAYIYVRKDSTAEFNAEITYMDASGGYHTVKLSQLAGNGDTDFPAGYSEFFVNFGDYVASQGHLTETGNVKYINCTYYVVGALDSYVKLYDMKFTPLFNIEDPYINLYGKDLTQGGAAGNYVYDGGTLTMNSTSADGYSVTFTPNTTLDPSDFVNLLMDVSSDAPFNVSMEVIRADGDATLEFRKEFFDLFGLTEAPEALPAGTWQPQMNLNGYFYWNGGLIEETTIKSITISLESEGTLTLAALQSSRSLETVYVTNDDYSEGSYNSETDAIVKGDVNGDGAATTVDARIIINAVLGTGTLNEAQTKAADYNGDGTVSTADVRELLFALANNA